MPDKTLLGSRYTCYECQTKFYDMGKPAPICPECSADQREAPVQDIKALLSKGGGRKPKAPPVEEEEPKPSLDDDGDDSDDDDDEDDLSLLGDDDDDDGDGDGDGDDDLD